MAREWVTRSMPAPPEKRRFRAFWMQTCISFTIQGFLFIMGAVSSPPNGGLCTAAPDRASASLLDIYPIFIK